MLSKRTTLAVLCAAALVACDAADSVTGPTEPTGPSLLGGTVPPIEQPPIEKPPIPPVEEFLPGVPVLDPFAPFPDKDEGVESARGSGFWHNQPSGALRTFAFRARNAADGTTSGEYQVDNQDVSGSRERGTVTCLEVVGNEAWIGGVITHSSVPDREGIRRLFRVVDNGDGSPPDQASILVLGEGPLSCEARPFIPVQDLEGGNIVVRDGGGTIALLP